MGKKKKGADEIQEIPSCITKILRGKAPLSPEEILDVLIRFYSSKMPLHPTAIESILRSVAQKYGFKLDELSLKEKLEKTPLFSEEIKCEEEPFSLICENANLCSFASDKAKTKEIIRQLLELERSPEIGSVRGFIPPDILYLFLSHGDHLTSGAILTPFGVYVDKGGFVEINRGVQTRLRIKEGIKPVINEKLLVEMVRISQELEERGFIETVNPVEMYEFYEGFLRRFWYHDDEGVYILLALWSIGTWFHPIFRRYPILNPRGEMGSGKTTLLELLMALVFNPSSIMSSFTPASLYRLAQDSNCTIFIDVVGISNEKESDLELQSILEASTERGGTVVRVNKDNLEVSVFRVYTPIVVASRTSLPLGEKFIEVITKKNTDPELKKIYNEELKKVDISWIWQNMLRLLLTKYMEVKEVYESLSPESWLSGRDFDYWAPLIALCKIFAPHKLEKFVEFIKRYLLSRMPSDFMMEVENTILVTVYRERSEKKLWLARELADVIEKTLRVKISSRRVRDAIDNLGILSRKTTKAGYTGYYFDFDIVERRLVERGLLEVEEKEENEAEKSESTHFHKKLEEIKDEELKEESLEIPDSFVDLKPSPEFPDSRDKLAGDVLGEVVPRRQREYEIERSEVEGGRGVEVTTEDLDVRVVTKLDSSMVPDWVRKRTLIYFDEKAERWVFRCLEGVDGLECGMEFETLEAIEAHLIQTHKVGE